MSTTLCRNHSILTNSKPQTHSQFSPSPHRLIAHCSMTQLQSRLQNCRQQYHIFVKVALDMHAKFRKEVACIGYKLAARLSSNSQTLQAGFADSFVVCDSSLEQD